MKVRYSRTDRLKNYIKEMIDSLPWGEKLKEQFPVLYWKDVAGERIYKITEVKEVKEGYLYVKVKDPIWMRELKMQERNLLEKYRKMGFYLKGIRFTGGI